MREPLEDRHIGLASRPPFCAACQSTVIPGEAVLALISSPHSTAYVCHTFDLPFESPKVHSNEQPASHSCSLCQESHEAFTVHIDCFNLFKNHCTSENALQRLWTTAAWGRPWSRAAPIPFRTATALPDRHMFSVIAEHQGDPMWKGLASLPTEILDMIKIQSLDQMFWSTLLRYATVFKLAGRLSTTGEEGLEVMPISQIYSWERGAMASGQSHGDLDLARLSIDSRDINPDLVRLSIDSSGIKRIESIHEYTDTSLKDPDCYAFIVEEKKDMAGINVELKDGLLRLALPDGCESLRIWDTPCPPPPSARQFYSAQPISSHHLRTISLDQVTGLTFFVTRGSVCGIHAHYSPTSSASDAFRELLPYQSGTNKLDWIYVPLAGTDRIEAVGIRKGVGGLFSILIKTSCNRVYEIGLAGAVSGEVTRLGHGPPVTLIYSDPGSTTPVHSWLSKEITTIGVHYSRSEVTQTTQDFLSMQPPICPTWGEKYYFRASLDNVSSARVFFDESYAEDESFCKGIIFQYEDGSQQAVGECRVNVSGERTFASPSRLYHKTVPYASYGLCGLTLEFGSESSHDDTTRRDDGWMSHGMEGMMTFWVTMGRSVLLFDDEQELP
ncbi:hypothetical protein F5884DRAFT_526306 [Xylogone sp. PMI_703]|nr:hypothetical protein F5884DRAFT_526306 [Xylogone sp. PMI_703]